MHVGDHRPHIPSRLWSFAAAPLLSPSLFSPSPSSAPTAEPFALFDVLFGALVPQERVAFVDRVDAAPLGHADAPLRQQELPEGRVEGEDGGGAVPDAEHEHAGRAVEAVARRDQIPPWPQGSLGRRGRGRGRRSRSGGGSGSGSGSISSLASFELLPVDAEDGPDGDPAVDVRGPVQRVEHDDVAARGARDDDRRGALLRDHRRDLPRAAKAGDEDVVGQDVQLLLVLPLDVLGPAGEAEDAGEAGLS